MLSWLTIAYIQQMLMVTQEIWTTCMTSSIDSAVVYWGSNF